MKGLVAGLGLLEVVVVTGLLGLGLLIVIPALGSLRASALTAAGAQRIALTLQSLRWKSVAQARGHGLMFDQDARGWIWYEVRDGNGNGLKTSEVRDGIDPTLSGPHRLEDTVAPVTLGFPSNGPFREIPPGTGFIDRLDDPIRLGNTQLLTFGPLGTASSGTSRGTGTWRWALASAGLPSRRG